MEDKDDFGFTNGFHAQNKKRHLDSDRGEEEKIVTGKGEVRGPEPAGYQDKRKQQSSKETCPCLFEAEEKEFPEKGVKPAGRDVILQADADFVKSRLGRGEHGRVREVYPAYFGGSAGVWFVDGGKLDLLFGVSGAGCGGSVLQLD